eukprot:scaffold5250_cov394-Prasinococcus_capsulatus_cf.AAC.2
MPVEALRAASINASVVAGAQRGPPTHKRARMPARSRAARAEGILGAHRAVERASLGLVSVLWANSLADWAIAAEDVVAEVNTKPIPDSVGLVTTAVAVSYIGWVFFNGGQERDRIQKLLADKGIKEAYQITRMGSLNIADPACVGVAAAQIEDGTYSKADLDKVLGVQKIWDSASGKSYTPRK